MKEKSQIKKERVLQTASRLITRYGFEKTTMEDIARESGVSKGALYLLWPGKDELFENLLTYEMTRLLADFTARMQNDPQGGQIGPLFRHALLALHDNPLICDLYTQDNRVLGDFVKRQDPGRYISRVLLGESSMRQMQAANLLRSDLRPEVLAYLFSLISVGFIYIGTILPSEHQPPLEELITAMTEMVQNGLAGSGEKSTAGKEAMQTMTEFVLQQYKEKESK